MTPGRVVLLNGTSSSGKSSIAEALLTVLPTPFFHIPVDAINGMRAKQRTRELDATAVAEVLHRTRAGYHRVLAGMARAGNDVIADYLLGESWRLPDLLDVLTGIDVLLVGVHCPLPELRRRERARGDREPGQAQAQFARVHAHGRYDLEVDTSVLDPTACALRIRDALADPPRPAAFDLLRADQATKTQNG